MDLGKGPIIYVLNQFAGAANAAGQASTMGGPPASLLSALAEMNGHGDGGSGHDVLL